MLIRLLTGVATSGPCFAEGEVIEWRSADPKHPHDSAQRLVQKNLAEPVKKEELGPNQRVKTYTEPPQQPHERWVIGKGQNPDAPRLRRPDEARIEHSKDE